VIQAFYVASGIDQSPIVTGTPAALAAIGELVDTMAAATRETLMPARLTASNRVQV
jgi:hypothetical protein